MGLTHRNHRAALVLVGQYLFNGHTSSPFNCVSHALRRYPVVSFASSVLPSSFAICPFCSSSVICSSCCQIRVSDAVDRPRCIQASNGRHIHRLPSVSCHCFSRFSFPHKTSFCSHRDYIILHSFIASTRHNRHSFLSLSPFRPSPTSQHPPKCAKAYFTRVSWGLSPRCTHAVCPHAVPMRNWTFPHAAP